MRTILLAILCAASTPALAAAYTYADYGLPDHWYRGKDSFDINTSTNEITFLDATDNFFTCSEADEFDCFYYDGISFYVPKKPISIGQSWVGNDLTFKVAREDRLTVLGVERRVWIITCDRKDRSDTFYYSERFGLLAIKFTYLGNKYASFFVTAGKTGFPR